MATPMVAMLRICGTQTVSLDLMITDPEMQTCTYTNDKIGDEEEGLGEGLETRAHFLALFYIPVLVMGAVGLSLDGGDERYRKLLIFPSPNTTRQR